MSRGFLAAALSAFVLTSFAQAHEGPELGTEELGALYTTLVTSLSQPAPTGKKEVCFTYGGKDHKTCLNEDAFSAAVRSAMPAYEKLLAAHCTDCTAEKKETLKRGFWSYWTSLKAKARLQAIKLTGWAGEMARLYGPSWVIYTVVVESLEHAVLWWLPPGAPTCLILQSLYFSTAGYAKNAAALATNRFATTDVSTRACEAFAAPVRELRFQNRLRRLFLPQSGELVKRSSLDREGAEEFLASTPFWGEVQTGSPDSAEARDGETDIAFLFSAEPVEARRWRAFQHGNGVRLLRELLSTLLDRQLEKDRITAADYRAAKRWLGSFGAFLRDYSGNLTAVAGSPQAPELAQARRAAVFQWRGILRLFEASKKFADADLSTLKTLEADLASLVALQKQFRRADFSGLPSDPVCAADLLEKAR